MKLHLGVNDVAYSDKDGSTTTGDVAEYLEDDYHVMRTFVELHEDEISDDIADAVVGAIESLQMGRPPKFEASGPLSKLESQFRQYLDRGEWQQASGQRIEAAEKGVSHRRKQPYKKRKARKAFIDTGLYQASFRAWLEG